VSDKEFVDLVRKMRGAQTFYFKTRSILDLRCARDYERKVDVELRTRAQAEAPQQGALL